MLYQGTINVASGSFANNWTGASGGQCFTIPKYGKNLYFEPNVATGQFQFFFQTGYSGLASPTGAAYWTTANVAAGPFTIPVVGGAGDTLTVAIYSGASACKVKIYVDPNP